MSKIVVFENDPVLGENKRIARIKIVIKKELVYPIDRGKENA